jgi:hypothetical protein
MVDDKDILRWPGREGATQTLQHSQFLAKLGPRDGRPRPLALWRQVDRVAQYPVKSQRRVFVEGYRIHFLGAAYLSQAEIQSGNRETRIVLATAKSLFLSGRDDLASDHRGSGRIVIQRRNPNDCLHTVNRAWHKVNGVSDFMRVAGSAEPKFCPLIHRRF